MYLLFCCVAYDTYTNQQKTFFPEIDLNLSVFFSIFSSEKEMKNIPKIVNGLSPHSEDQDKRIISNEAQILGNGKDENADNDKHRPEGVDSWCSERSHSLSGATWPGDISSRDRSTSTVFLRLKSGSFRDITQACKSVTKFEN